MIKLHLYIEDPDAKKPKPKCLASINCNEEDLQTTIKIFQLADRSIRKVKLEKEK